MTDMSKVTPENIITKLHLHKREQSAAVCMIAIQEIERLREDRRILLSTLRMLLNTTVQLAPYDPAVAEGVIAIMGVAHETISKMEPSE